MKYNERTADRDRDEEQVWEARPRWRITWRGEIAFGPGKADVLEAIDRTGSISSAAAALGMAYRRAWLLVATMNRCFRPPLVATTRNRRQGAALTATGRLVLHLYRRIEAGSRRAARSDLAALRRLLDPAPPAPAGRGTASRPLRRRRR